MNIYIISGLISGIVGLISFLIIHHFWIQPIWFIFLPGVILASLGGAAVGWSFQTIQIGLPEYPWTFLGLALVIFIILLPGIIIAEFTPAPFSPDGSISPGYTPMRAVLQFFLEMVLSTIVVGAILGWYLGGTREATLSTAVAGLVFAIGPGHNIPFLGNTPGALKGTLFLVMIILASAVALMVSVEILGSTR